MTDNHQLPGADTLEKIKAVCTYKAVGGLPIPEKGKVFVYVLLCKDNSFYIGITDDLYRRWYEHKTGQGAKWTKINEPIKVIHYEVFTSRSDAVKREKDLKTGFGRKWLKREYEKYLRIKSGLPAPECKLRQAGEMEYNEELGKEIPKGWRVGRLGEFIEFVKGKRPRIVFDSYKDGLLPQILIDVLDGGNPSFADPKDMVISDEKDVIMIMDGASSGRTERGFAGILGSTIAEIKVKELNQDYIYYFLKRREEEIKENTTGTSIPHADKEKIKKYLIVVPPKKILNNFTSCIEHIFNRQVLGRKEIKTLSSIRDLLLPKLMSGKIRVPACTDSSVHEVQTECAGKPISIVKDKSKEKDI